MEQERPCVTVKWYAASGDVVRRGPYDSQVEAWEALVLSPAAQAREGRKHPRDAQVWPERASQQSPTVGCSSHGTKDSMQRKHGSGRSPKSKADSSKNTSSLSGR